MENLIAACLLFLTMHWLVSGGPLRVPIVNILGENLFKILFALITTINLVWMGVAYSNAPYEPTWGQITDLIPVTVIIMFVVCIMLPMSIFDKNPTLLGLVSPENVKAKGMLRITRHAGLIALGLWGVAHFIANGDWASHIMFGTIAFEGLIGPLNLDRKYKARYGQAWDKFAAQTSYLPMGAIFSGRNKFVLKELNKWGLALGICLFVFLLYFHQDWFGGLCCLYKS